jgi:hypothetical protein
MSTPTFFHYDKMASSATSSAIPSQPKTQSKAQPLCNLVTLWPVLFHELKIAQFDRWTKQEDRIKLRELRRQMNTKEIVADLGNRGHLLAQAAAFLEAKIAWYEMEYASCTHDEMAALDEELDRLQTIQEAAEAWSQHYKTK